MGDKILGSTVPRVHTPPLVLEPIGPCVCGACGLTPETSRGFDLIAFAEQVLEIELLPWQQFLAIHGLELTDDGLPRFQTVVVEVARQQGKTEFSKVLILFYMYLLQVALVVGAAQDIAIARKIWLEVVSTIRAVPELQVEVAGQPRKTNGQIELWLTGERLYTVKPPTDGGARGLSSDLVIMDELRQQKDWKGWGALTATTAARPDSQVWAFSNAGDVSSIVLRHLRMQAHLALGDPDGVFADTDADALLDEDVDEREAEATALGWFEWSAPPGLDPMDRAGWKWSAPSLNHGARPFVTERKLAALISAADPAVALMEYSCQWFDGSATGPFSPGSWDATSVEDVESARIVGKADACVHVSRDRSRAYVAACGEDAQGRTVFTVLDVRPGVDWVRGFLEENRDRITSVTGQTRGAWVSDLMGQLEADPSFRVPVVDWQGGDLTAAYGQMFDALRDKTAWHVPQPALDLAAATGVTKDLGGGWILDDRKSTCDVAPLSACVGALWLHRRPRKSPPPPAKPATPIRTNQYAGASGIRSTQSIATVGF